MHNNEQIAGVHCNKQLIDWSKGPAFYTRSQKSLQHTTEL